MNYIGSKLSLLDFLQDTITKVTGGLCGEACVFADLFAGTGVVAAAFRAKGYTVIANDLQYYSYVLNKHYIEATPEIDLALLWKLNALPGIDGFVYQNFCAGSGSQRNYFSDENGRRCDAIRVKLEQMYQEREITEETYFFYLASLIQSIDKYANVASVYGAFLKSLKQTARRNFSLELLPVIDGPRGNVYNEDTNCLIQRISGDILYLDPPYNARQYCANYHVLETIARYDNPLLKGITGMRETDKQKSAYCSKRQVLEKFEELIARAKFRYIFLSYNNEGLMDIAAIRTIMEKYGRYSVYAKEYRRFKADSEKNRNIAANTTTEYLHCLVKDK